MRHLNGVYAIPRSSARDLNGAEFARYARNAQRFFIGSHKSVSPVVSVVKTIMALYNTEQVAEMFDNSDIDAEVEEDPAFPLPAVESDDEVILSPPPSTLRGIEHTLK